MLTMGFETTISTSEPSQTYALDKAATGIGISQDTVHTILETPVNIHYKNLCF